MAVGGGLRQVLMSRPLSDKSHAALLSNLDDDHPGTITLTFDWLNRNPGGCADPFVHPRHIAPSIPAYRASSVSSRPPFFLTDT